MAGDRDADMGAAYQHGVRGFRVDPSIGLAGILERALDDDDRVMLWKYERRGPLDILDWFRRHRRT